MLPEEHNPRLDRVSFELRASGVRPQLAKPLRSGIHTRGYLPHVKREGCRYFVTFRLADSLPKEVFFRIQRKKAQSLALLEVKHPAERKLGRVSSKEELRKLERNHFRELDAYLDKGLGECFLRRADIAGLVSQTLKFFAGERYFLSAWVVMPTHVHVVLRPIPNWTLSAILQSWKTFSAREANKVLGRSGETFWQPESYDHWIRNDVEHERCCRYVVNNPVKAGLCRHPADWQWSSAWPGK